MFSSSFTMSEQEHRQWTPYKQAAPDTVMCMESNLERVGNADLKPWASTEPAYPAKTKTGFFVSSFPRPLSSNHACNTMRTALSVKFFQFAWSLRGSRSTKRLSVVL